MQPPHALGGLDVDRVLFLVGRGLIARDKAEQPDVFIKLCQGEFVLFPFLKVVKPEAGKVGNEDIAGGVPVLEPGK